MERFEIQPAAGVVLKNLASCYRRFRSFFLTAPQQGAVAQEAVWRPNSNESGPLSVGREMVVFDRHKTPRPVTGRLCDGLLAESGMADAARRLDDNGS